MRSSIFIAAVFCCAQSCPAPCNPMDCSLAGSSIYGVSQARILQWWHVGSSSLTRDHTQASYTHNALLATGPTGKFQQSLIFFIKEHSRTVVRACKVLITRTSIYQASSSPSSDLNIWYILFHSTLKPWKLDTVLVNFQIFSAIELSWSKPWLWILKTILY